MTDKVEIVHALKNRIRLRVSGKEMQSTLETLATQLRQQTGVYEIRKNVETGSLTVYFDALTLPLPQLLEQLQQYGVTETIKNDTLATWKSAAYWKKQGKTFLPILTGLLVARGLKLVGWRAILAYILTASATRELIKEIEQLDWEKSVLLPVSPLLRKENSSEQTMPYEHEQWQKNGFLPSQVENQTPPKITYDIVHAIPGRVRFQVPRIAEDIEYAQRLQQLVESTEGVTGVRVNTRAGAIIITYDISLLSPGQMRSRITELIQDAAEVKAPPPPTPPLEIKPPENDKITAAYETVSDTAADTTEATLDIPAETENPSEEESVSELTSVTETTFIESENNNYTSEEESKIEIEESTPESMESETAENTNAIATDEKEIEPLIQTEEEGGIEPSLQTPQTQAILCKTEAEEPLNIWPCFWQTIRSTIQGLRAGLPPIHALIAGLKDAGAIS
ncbi:MAG: hypothetical protein N3E45_15775 [Oscillatoriaceae bacterium SKW80]|nr:hypothetical protein [Oscillatoriaceae bacterium SKYG93]MCX8122257.1 hypothetical protein [Oscillatoriaceae bacterium SKW80]MDW8454543.1 hypothetical protein [Oscillatoriaceae cyanobacterium SKYGB_i_bin93]HIK29405.1 hypothetical protein [Oscillatoriaceae cyanobacterium M7585_C2015_266]